MSIQVNKKINRKANSSYNTRDTEELIHKISNKLGRHGKNINQNTKDINELKNKIDNIELYIQQLINNNIQMQDAILNIQNMLETYNNATITVRNGGIINITRDEAIKDLWERTFNLEQHIQDYTAISNIVRFIANKKITLLLTIMFIISIIAINYSFFKEIGLLTTMSDFIQMIIDIIL